MAAMTPTELRKFPIKVLMFRPYKTYKPNMVVRIRHTMDRLEVDWDLEQTEAQNAERAAYAFATHLGLTGKLVGGELPGGEYAFVFVY